MAIELVDKIKQKNGLKFKLLDAVDIETTFLDKDGNTRDLEDVLKYNGMNAIILKQGGILKIPRKIDD